MPKIGMISGKVKKTPATAADTNRYSFIDLANTEPDAGVPSSNNSLFSSTTGGTRSWLGLGSNISVSGGNLVVDSAAALSTNYVATITGTTNEIEVTGGTGIGSTPQIGLPDDVQITTSLTVNGQPVLTEIVNDTTPQLGGDLDVNGFSIISARSNEDIILDPAGTGLVVAVTGYDMSVGPAYSFATKGYVDAQVSSGVAPLDIAGDTGTADAITLGTETLTFSGTASQISTSTSSGTSTVTFSLPSTINVDTSGSAASLSTNYVASITGTANEIEVTGGTGIGATPQIGLPDDVQITSSLTVNGQSVLKSFTIADDTSTTTAINDGDVLTIAGSTGIGTAITDNATTPILTITGNTYAISSVTSGSDAIIRLTASGNDAGTDDITLVAGTNVTLTQSGGNQITIDAADTDTNTTYSISAETDASGAALRLTGSDASTDDVIFAEGSNVTITRTDANTITIASTASGTFNNFSIADDTSTTTTINDGDTVTIAGGTDITSVMTDDPSFPVLTLNNTSTLDSVTGRGSTTTNGISVSTVTATGTITANDFEVTGTGAASITTSVTNGNIEIQANGSGTIELLSDTNVTGDLNVNGNAVVTTFQLSDDSSTLTTVNGSEVITIAGGTDISTAITDDPAFPIVTVNSTSTLDSVTGRGATTANSITVGALTVDQIDISGNTIAANTTNADLNLNPSGTGNVVISNLRYPTSDGAADSVLITDGAGNITFANLLTTATTEKFTGDGSTTVFTLDTNNLPTAESTYSQTGIIVSINGIVQIPGDSYALSGTRNETLTFTEAVPNTYEIEVRNIVTTKGGGTGSKHIIQNNGVNLNDRDKLNFDGTYLIATDDAINNQSDVNVSTSLQTWHSKTAPSGTVVGTTDTQTLTNKTIDLTSNTLTGTTAEFNTALSDGSFATLAGTETLTNKTIDLTSNTLTGTTAEFNTALSDGSFATLAGIETLTNKTINLASNTITGTVAEFNTAVSDGNFASAAFSTVAVSGQTDVTADNEADTLTFVAGSNMTITTSGNSVTFAASGSGSFSSFNVVDDTSTSLTITDSEDLAILGGTGIGTSISSDSLTITGNTYAISSVTSGSDAIIRLTATGNDVGTDDITLVAGTNVTLTQSGGNQITIAATDTTGITEVVQDTTPQLGGDLDVNGFSIISARSNENIVLDPAGTGTVELVADTNVTGAFTATSKSFLIDHPTKSGMKLRYASLEGPENGVYVRGRLTNSNTIKLPDYWVGLVHEHSITVNLTPVGSYQQLYVTSTQDNIVEIANNINSDIDCFYTVYAERKDIDKLTVEY